MSTGTASEPDFMAAFELAALRFFRSLVCATCRHPHLVVPSATCPCGCTEQISLLEAESEVRA